MAEEQLIKCKRHGASVLTVFNELRLSDELCDFSITTQGHTFKVHKALLAATSEYFRVMFRGLMQESITATVNLKGMTADSVRSVIEFIYSGEIRLNMDNLPDIVNASSHLQVSTALEACSEYITSVITFRREVSTALEACSEYITSVITFDNSEEFLHIADMYSLTSVQEHWDKMILMNFHEYSVTPAFLKSTAENLCKYLSSNALWTSSEYRLFQFMELWFKTRTSPTVSDAEKILKHIRFGLMSENELNAARKSCIVSIYPPTVQFINNGMQYHTKAKDGHPYLSLYCSIRTDDHSMVFIHHGTSNVPFRVTAYNLSTTKFYDLFTDGTGSRDCIVTVLDNFAYISRIVDFGGGTLMCSLTRFDPRHLTSISLRPMKRLRLDFCFISFGDSLYAIGGCTENFVIHDSIECYHVKTNTWDELCPLPRSTHSLAATVKDDSIYISGGVTLVGAERQETNQFYRYNPRAQSWEDQPGMHCARRLHDMITVGSYIYVLGGMPRAGTQQLGQIPIERYNFDTSQWTVLSSTLSGRSIGHYTVFNDKILSLGHEHHQAAEDEVWFYDTVNDKWTRYAKLPQHRSLASCASVKLKVNFIDEKVARTLIR